MNSLITRSLLAVSMLVATVGTASVSQALGALPHATAQILNPELGAILAASHPDESMIVFVHSATIEEAVRAIDSAGLELVERWTRIGVAVAAGIPEAIRRVATDPSVSYVEPNREIELALDSAHIASRARDARDSANGLLSPADLPYDGSGVTIAINDTGIDKTHPMFMQDGSSKVVRNLRQMCPDLLGVCDEWVDVDNSDVADGHGNLVAGVAGGFERVARNGRTVRGAAPGSKLVGLGSSLTPLALYGGLSGLNWILENHLDPCGDGSCPPIKVVNNSWSPGGQTNFNPEDAASKLADKLVADGVVVVFAAANAGGNGSVNQVNAYAQNPTPGVIGVANYDDAGMGSRDNGLHPSSSRGLESDPSTYPDLAAPGTDITSACSAATPYYCLGVEGDGAAVDPYYGTTYGTSLSSPYVAGVVALLLEANPALTPAQIEYLLEDTAHQFGSSDYVADPRNPSHTTSFDRGHGLVDVAAALGAVLNRQVPAGPTCDGGVIVDPEGDATDVIIRTGLPPAASERGLDITRAWVSTDPATGALTFAVRLADLGELPPSGAVGEYLRFYFTYRYVPYAVHMQRLGGDAEVSASFHLQTGGVADRVIIADNLEGSFDPVGDVVRTVVPANTFNVWDAALPEIENDDILSGLQLEASRPYGSRPAVTAFLIADTARGGCPYIVGS